LRVSFASKLARALGTGAAAVVLAAAWLAAPSAHAQDPQRGAKLFQFCTQCHGADAGGNPQFLAPNLTGLPEWYLVAQLKNFHTGLRGMHPDDVAGMRMFPMTRVFRDEGDIPAVAAHIAQLPVVTPAPTISDGDATRGASFYQVCIACHGPDGRGNQALNAPPLVQESDWYLLSSLQRYKDGVRGNDPRNANAQIMRGMAGTLADEQAMKDVITYIKSLGGAQAAQAPAQ